MNKNKHNNFSGINDVNNYQGRYDVDNFMFRRGLNNVAINNTDEPMFRTGTFSFQKFRENEPIIECNTRSMGCITYKLPKSQNSFDVTCNTELLETSNFTDCDYSKRDVRCIGIVSETSSFNGVPKGCLKQNNVYSCTDSEFPKFSRNAQDVYSNQTGNITNVLNQANDFLKNIFNPNQQPITIGNVPSDVNEEKITDGKEIKILGMSPITFGIVSLGVVIVGSIITYKLIKK